MSAKKLVVSTYLQYIFIVLGALLLFALVRQLGGVLLTFLLSAVLAYALNPVVRLLEGWRIPRAAAVLGVFLTLVAAVLAALLFLILPAISQVQALVQNPEALTDGGAGLVERVQELPYVGEQISSMDQSVLSEFVWSNVPSAGQVLNGALGFIGGVFGVFGTILNLLLMLIVAIYLLLDRERITRVTLSMVPETMREQTKELYHVVEDTLMKYLKAQLLLCGIMGTIGGAIAFLTFRDYALLIGLRVGVIEIFPVIGAFLVAVPAAAIALFAGWLDQALLVSAFFLLAQQLEGNVLVPRVMSGSVGVHPLWVLFATLAATALYGVVGAIFAVPIVAIVAATLRYLRETLLCERWRKSLVTQAPPRRSGCRVPGRGDAGRPGLRNG